MPACLPNRANIFLKAAGDNGAPRSDVKMKRGGGFCSRFNRRKDR